MSDVFVKSDTPPKWKMSSEYVAIKRFYAGKKAERSGVPYMNHIDEGMVLCDHLGYSDEVRRAFCVHPIFQADEAFGALTKERLDPNAELGFQSLAFKPYIVMLAVEYRSKANSYLSNKVKKVEEISLSPNEEVNQMLIIDKVQNRKDFEKYHLGTHARSDILDQYFRNWLERLGVSEEKYQELKTLIW